MVRISVWIYEHKVKCQSTLGYVMWMCLLLSRFIKKKLITPKTQHAKTRYMFNLLKSSNQLCLFMKIAALNSIDCN